MSKEEYTTSVELHFTDNLDDFMQSDIFKDFQKRCDDYTEHVLAKAMDGLSDKDKMDFMCWYGNMQYENFWEERSEAVSNAILWTISMGLG